MNERFIEKKWRKVRRLYVIVELRNRRGNR